MVNDMLRSNVNDYLYLYIFKNYFDTELDLVTYDASVAGNEVSVSFNE